MRWTKPARAKKSANVSMSSSSENRRRVIQQCASRVDDGVGMLEVVVLLAPNHTAQEWLPHRQLAERPFGDGEAVRVEQGETGLQFPVKRPPVVVGEFDHGVGTARPFNGRRTVGPSGT